MEVYCADYLSGNQLWPQQTVCSSEVSLPERTAGWQWTCTYRHWNAKQKKWKNNKTIQSGTEEIWKPKYENRSTDPFVDVKYRTVYVKGLQLKGKCLPVMWELDSGVSDLALVKTWTGPTENAPTAQTG